jgi:hypothetical protein
MKKRVLIFKLLGIKGGSIIHKIKDKENIAKIDNIFISELIDYRLLIMQILHTKVG